MALRPIQDTLRLGLSISLLGMHCAWVHAGSGFELRSQSATTLGSAQAGMTAGAADVTTLIFNPAALGYGIRFEGAVGVTGLATRVGFDPASASTVLGTPITGDHGGNAGTKVAIPNLYIGMDASPGVRLGLAVAPRFGLGSYWSSSWVGRYYALKSELTTIDIVPTISFRVDPTLVLGLSADIEYAKIKTTSAIDFGTIDQVLTMGAFGGIPAGSDGFTAAKADSWGAGFATGLIYEPTPGTRLGASYHSKIRQRLSGNATFTPGGPVGQGVAATSGAFQDTTVSSTLNMPASATVGIAQELGRWTVLADAKWTDWSTLGSLRIEFGNPAQPPAQTSYSWHDSWFFALGGRYQLDDRAALRLGVAYDQSPTRNETRNPTIPDSSSRWAAIGLEYRLSPTTKLDLAYGHVAARNAPIAQQATGDNTFRGNLTGNITGSRVDYLAIQIGRRF